MIRILHIVTSLWEQLLTLTYTNYLFCTQKIVRKATYSKPGIPSAPLFHTSHSLNIFFM